MKLKFVYFFGGPSKWANWFMTWSKEKNLFCKPDTLWRLLSICKDYSKGLHQIWFRNQVRIQINQTISYIQHIRAPPVSFIISFSWSFPLYSNGFFLLLCLYNKHINCYENNNDFWWCKSGRQGGWNSLLKLFWQSEVVSGTLWRIRHQAATSLQITDTGDTSLDPTATSLQTTDTGDTSLQLHPYRLRIQVIHPYLQLLYIPTDYGYRWYIPTATYLQTTDTGDTSLQLHPYRLQIQVIHPYSYIPTDCRSRWYIPTATSLQTTDTDDTSLQLHPYRLRIQVIHPYRLLQIMDIGATSLRTTDSGATSLHHIDIGAASLQTTDNRCYIPAAYAYRCYTPKDYGYRTQVLHPCSILGWSVEFFFYRTEQGN